MGCECTNCSNINRTEAEVHVPEGEIADIVIDEEVSKDGGDEVEDIMDWVFGNEEAEAEQETHEHSELAEDSEFLDFPPC